MKRIILIYGLIAGVIVAAMMFITMPMYNSGSLNVDNGELVGYTTMVIALSMIFFGVKSYRDNHQNGEITFGKGFKIGILIALIASVMYALAWEVTYNNMSGDFMEKMTVHYIEKMKKSGASEQELQAAKEKWEGYSAYYKNPITRFGLTLMEILPVGVVIALATAALLMKKNFLPFREAV
jgi:hypothetical protein